MNFIAGTYPIRPNTPRIQSVSNLVSNAAPPTYPMTFGQRAQNPLK
jgi:hypothetical protein